LLEDTEEKIIEIFSKLLLKESYESGEIVENMKQYFSKAPEIQKKVATDNVIMEEMQSEEFIKNIMEKIRNKAEISVDKEYIIEKIGLIKKGYEQYLETEVEKNKNKYEDKNRKKRKDYRDKLVANWIGYNK
jgi:exoribonuclease R